MMRRPLVALDGSARCRGEGVQCTVLEDVGRPDQQIVREAQSCDVVILGREENFHFETEARDDETLGRAVVGA